MTSTATRLSSFLVAFSLLTPAGLNLPAQSATGPATEKTYSRNEITTVIANDRKIVTPNGVETLVPVQINGAKQWLSIRGKDKRNPILLFLHGGPGQTFMPWDWTVQEPWEDYFTVVQWDQRGAGKTFGSNDPTAIDPTMTVEQMTNDAVEVVSYLRKSFGKEKIILVGHSWGTILGAAVARKHPDWLYAYVGIGQFVDSARNEEDGYRFALSQAKEHGNAEAVKELEGIAPYPGEISKLGFEKIGTERKWVGYYGGLAYGRQDLDFYNSLALLSPDYTLQDIDNIGAGAGYSVSHLFAPLMNLDISSDTTFHCPIFLFEGRYDYATSHALAAEWFSRINAPQKELVWFENSAHMVMEEEPGRFLMSLVTKVRPLAVRAGDAPPEDLFPRSHNAP